MRVIAGTARGHKLVSVPGKDTRPITDRAKEALFSILESSIVDARVLDLFGGTGAVGIEALSRGAAEAVFVERASAAVKVIGRNLEKTRLKDKARIVRGDAFKYLLREGLQPFDLIYVAPPQYKGLWSQALSEIDRRSELLQSEGDVIVQIHPKEYQETQLQNLARYDTRTYGSVQLDFYGLEEDMAR
ncbi:MAG: 16S rRNA (guanine(966)-N(2))-methyltransferase RsmD [Chloroflexi bacterium]|nr:16S rRNA (guanine(966)-N(2))-methyltransferase RsmD [Chloroflexota bacterium]